MAVVVAMVAMVAVAVVAVAEQLSVVPLVVTSVKNSAPDRVVMVPEFNRARFTSLTLYDYVGSRAGGADEYTLCIAHR